MTSSSQEVIPFDVEAPSQPQYIQHFYNDYDLVLKAFARWNVDITEFLDPEFQAFSEQFKNLSGNQLSNIIGSILACGGSTFAYSMNGAIASQCTSLTPVLRALIATSPLAVGGVLRILSAAHADEGWGKNNILLLLSLSVLGMAMNIAILQYIDLPTLAPQECWPLILAGVFIGLGLGTYASGMILGTRSASNVSTAARRNNLKEISSILTRAVFLRGDISSTQTIHIEPDFISNNLSFILHRHAGVYSAVIAGIANASPFIPITINANPGSLSNTEIISLLASLQILIMIGINLFLQNPIYDQLLKSMQQATPEQVRRLALYGGQTLFPSAFSLKEEFSQLTPEEIKGLWIAVIFYSASYGVLLSLSTTGVSTMMSKCLTRVESLLVRLLFLLCFVQFHCYLHL